MTTIAEAASRLSEAQRKYLTEKAKWRKPRSWSQPRWVTFPPSNTHRVLMSHGLVDAHGQILDHGLAVRDHLIAEQGGDRK